MSILSPLNTPCLTTMCQAGRMSLGVEFVFQTCECSVCAFAIVVADNHYLAADEEDRSIIME